MADDVSFEILGMSGRVGRGGAGTQAWPPTIGRPTAVDTGRDDTDGDGATSAVVVKVVAAGPSAASALRFTEEEVVGCCCGAAESRAFVWRLYPRRARDDDTAAAAATTPEIGIAAKPLNAPLGVVFTPPVTYN